MPVSGTLNVQLLRLVRDRKKISAVRRRMRREALAKDRTAPSSAISPARFPESALDDQGNAEDEAAESESETEDPFATDFFRDEAGKRDQACRSPRSPTSSFLRSPEERVDAGDETSLREENVQEDDEDLDGSLTSPSSRDGCGFEEQTKRLGAKQLLVHNPFRTLSTPVAAGTLHCHSKPRRTQQVHRAAWVPSLRTAVEAHLFGAADGRYIFWMLTFLLLVPHSAAVDARVSVCPSGQPNNRGLFRRTLATATLTASRKSSYRRAARRAMTNGSTVYLGRTYSSSDLQQLAYHRRCTRTRCPAGVKSKGVRTLSVNFDGITGAVYDSGCRPHLTI